MMVVIDTNVLVAGLRSKLGASNLLLMRLADGEFQAAISTALCLEYAEVLHRPGILGDSYSSADIDDFLDSFCAVSKEVRIYFNWRPFLPDQQDDLVFECALAAGASHIITHNLHDFRGVEALGLSAVTPHEFMLTLSKS